MSGVAIDPPAGAAVHTARGTETGPARDTGFARDDGPARSTGSPDAEAVAEETALGALLRCCVREVAGPRGQVWAQGVRLTLRLGGRLIRVPASGGLALRFDGPPLLCEDGAWRRLTLERLVRLVQEELSAPADGPANDEFAGQVLGSRAAVAAVVRGRAGAAAPEDEWLASEQALVSGHPFHPSPKARGGQGWLRYAPETHARFPLRLLGVRDDLVASGGDASALDGLGAAPAGYTALPAHPWQLGLLREDLAAPLADGRLVDLGETGAPAVPTSSVRTVYEPGVDRCLKFSLDVRITNCVRKNAWYELVASAELSARLEPVFAALALGFPGTRWLPEPGWRSASLGTRLLEGLGVIVRASPWRVAGPGVTPVLAGALAAPGPLAGHGARTRAALRAMRAEPLAWWAAYVDRVAPPVLEAYLRHGVVLEPHLQNVLAGLDGDGMPARAVFRDLEGTKLVAGRHDLSGLPGRVAAACTYDAARGWDRVVYCLMVNHLPEIAATVAGTAAGDGPAAAGLLRELWAVAHARLARYAGERPPPRLARLLAGAPLPAKANLSVRWARSADRDAVYVPVASPFAGVGA
ncbi:IucA/IucC family protein [Sphaerisporangium sp. B11E5]|uniref:IucA/IucC family protein n=1 Tax=Sphaerisporangium sp. B11E5 TaxID=3153563 RepID=UPI00325E7D74